MFHDRAHIHALAGRGGDGGLSFRREKYVPKGGPDGGDGGRGGDVVVHVDPSLRDLSAFRRIKHVKAGKGGNGRGSKKHGADGDDAELRVPVGTQLIDGDGRVVADLTSPNGRVVVARGGQGGRGNARFATPTRQTPRFAETGLPGNEIDLELRLKLVVDAALAGFPNAGKSSLLRRISNAKPKVADYPFTTLEPVLGVVDGPEERQLTVADVPGLIEGAADGAGLGHQFLAHLERARLLVHVLDASEPDLEERFRTIDRELAEYGAGLDARPQLVVLNKIDLVGATPTFALDDDRVLRVVATSCATGAGIAELKLALFELCPVEPPLPASDEALPEFLDYTPKRPTWAALPHSPHRPRLPRRRHAATAGRARGRSARPRDKAWRARGGRRGGARMAVTGILGGVFDPPHDGHVALGRTAVRALRLSELLVLVVAEPGHKHATTPAQTRLELTRLAFEDLPEAVVELDEHARTVDSLEARRPADAYFVLGSDELAAFETWKSPERVLELVRLAVAMRPGVDRAEVESVRRRLAAPDRIVEFDMDPVPVSSSEIRARVARGEPIADWVPARVADAIARLGLYVAPE